MKRAANENIFFKLKHNVSRRHYCFLQAVFQNHTMSQEAEIDVQPFVHPLPTLSVAKKAQVPHSPRKARAHARRRTRSRGWATPYTHPHVHTHRHHIIHSHLPACRMRVLAGACALGCGLMHDSLLVSCLQSSPSWVYC